MGKSQNFIGQRVGIVEVTGVLDTPENLAKPPSQRKYTCLCDCGTEMASYYGNLLTAKKREDRGGTLFSCGCIAAAVRKEESKKRYFRYRENQAWTKKQGRS